ncbi:threonine synthase [Candidatus Scalindua japonica]|uniref:Threonine synthase n=1 Tax=Candidatus Scalindua japonica TaxID=1284222 RepID=A0A286TT86_9BACT|nr:hypothetical protein [Candidatus Scalindua japonica]GAX59112.1 threonine synthase [Candidatus Scalindua japonica]GAX59118.1 threonine synthase [Candidatus Scalindua japonica]
MKTEYMKDIVQIFALFSAGGFFLYKLVTGYLITNLSISLECFRSPGKPDSEKDTLVTIVKFKKGDRGSLELHDAQVKYDMGEDTIEVPLLGLDRRSFLSETICKKDRKLINWGARSKSSPFIRLSPGEETEFSCSCLVPSGQLCQVEVAILGKRTNHSKVGQWRASKVIPANNEI